MLPYEIIGFVTTGTENIEEVPAFRDICVIYQLCEMWLFAVSIVCCALNMVESEYSDDSWEDFFGEFIFVSNEPQVFRLSTCRVINKMLKSLLREMGSCARYIISFSPIKWINIDITQLRGYPGIWYGHYPAWM